MNASGWQILGVLVVWMATSSCYADAHFNRRYDSTLDSVLSNAQFLTSPSSSAKALASKYGFDFRYRETTGGVQSTRKAEDILGIKSFKDNPNSLQSLYIDQYDATIYYPVSRKWMNLDLGLNLKLIESRIYSEQDSGRYEWKTHFRAYPMFSAAALFDLPLQGVTASVEGRYANFDAREMSEYRAKLSYQFDNIFGVSGGWEQQQYQLDSSNSLNFDKQGPFVDLFFRF